MVLNLEDVLNEWEKDSVIDRNNPDQSTVDIAKMHSKYLKLHALTKLQLKKTEISQKMLLKDKWLYYNGKMSAEEIDDKGWKYDPFDGLRVMKGEMDYYYNSDPDIQKTEEKITYYKTLLETLQEIIDTIKWRHTAIGNIVKWHQFQAGG